VILIEEIDINSEYYPETLKEINKSPQKIYALGNIELLNKPGIAIVGSRHVSNYGIRVCKYFASGFAKRGIPIISGMALGIDSIAHKEAVKFNSPTIAVLGTGFNHIFPKENLELMQEILDTGGLVITEYPPDTEYRPSNFPKRNRIISGLSIGVLVIEAAYRSGTSITANWANKQGKKVFAVPGRLDLSNRSRSK
jgi:DNA processing protein